MNKFERGTIAINAFGSIGLILGRRTYESGDSVFTGIRLDDHFEGAPWDSVQPKFVCRISDLMKRFDGDTFVIPDVLPFDDRLNARPMDCSGGEIGPPLEVPARQQRRSCI